MEKESKIKWELFVAGDKSSYAWLYEKYVQLLFSYGLCFTTDRELIKDCIQDVFVKLYQKRARLSVPDNVKAYLLVVFKNTLIDALGKESLYLEEKDMSLGQLQSDPAAEDKYVDKEEIKLRKQKIDKILSQLPSRQKEVIYYRYIQELKLDEITGLMGMNYQSVQNLLQRSLKKFRALYDSVTLFIILLLVLLNEMEIIKTIW